MRGLLEQDFKSEFSLSAGHFKGKFHSSRYDYYYTTTSSDTADEKFFPK